MTSPDHPANSMAENKKKTARAVVSSSLPTLHYIDANVNSPYTDPSVSVRFETDGGELYIPPHLLAQSEKLESMVSYGQTLRLDMPSDAGHVLVHYLFTSTYQCLKPKGTLPEESLAAEFLTSARVYNAAQAYVLPHLVELAKAEIERLGKLLKASLVFDLIRQGHPYPSTEDVWLGNYLKARLRLFLEGPTESSIGDIAPEHAVISIGDILFNSMLELYHENSSLGKDK